MEPTKQLREALEALLENLSREDHAPDGGSTPAPDRAAAHASQADTAGETEGTRGADILRELTGYLAETGDDVAGLLARHPAAAAGAAFLLGVAVGRLSK